MLVEQILKISLSEDQPVLETAKKTREGQKIIWFHSIYHNTPFQPKEQGTSCLPHHPDPNENLKKVFSTWQHCCTDKIWHPNFHRATQHPTPKNEAKARLSSIVRSQLRFLERLRLKAELDTWFQATSVDIVDDLFVSMNDVGVPCNLVWDHPETPAVLGFCSVSFRGCCWTDSLLLNRPPHRALARHLAPGHGCRWRVAGAEIVFRSKLFDLSLST